MSRFQCSQNSRGKAIVWDRYHYSGYGPISELVQIKFDGQLARGSAPMPLSSPCLVSVVFRAIRELRS